VTKIRTGGRDEKGYVVPGISRIRIGLLSGCATMTGETAEQPEERLIGKIREIRGQIHQESPEGGRGKIALPNAQVFMRDLYRVENVTLRRLGSKGSLGKRKQSYSYVLKEE